MNKKYFLIIYIFLVNIHIFHEKRNDILILIRNRIEKLKDYSILSELSEENFSAFSGENSVYTLSDEISNNCQIRIQSILTNIKKKINFKNKLPITFLNIQKSKYKKKNQSYHLGQSNELNYNQK